MPDILALIPARGGSKGIPRKNILPIAGKPLIAYSIEAALASKLVTRVIVSTDDIQIATVAGKYGAERMLRPPEYATDESPDIDTFSHVLNTLKAERGPLPHLIVHLRPTCPIRKQGDIDKAIQIMLDHPNADSLRSVSKAKQSPLKMWSIALQGMDGIGEMTPALIEQWQMLRVPPAEPGSFYFKELHSMPRQMLPTFYHQNGYIDVIRASTIERGYMAGDVVLPFIVEPAPLDLDYPEDVAKVEQAILHERGEIQMVHWGSSHYVFTQEQMEDAAIRHAV